MEITKPTNSIKSACRRILQNLYYHVSNTLVPTLWIVVALKESPLLCRLRRFVDFIDFIDLVDSVDFGGLMRVHRTL